MPGRETILNAARKNKPAFIEAPPAWAEGASIAPEQLTQKFIKTLESIGGKVIQCNDYDPIRAKLQEQLATGRFIANTIQGLGATSTEVQTNSNAQSLEPVEMAFIAGTLAVAENGAVWVYESQLLNRLLPFICQHLVLVVSRETLVSTMHAAYRKLDIAAEGYGVFIAGPSKTADIEQSLVIGAHGARSLLVYLVGGTEI
ncbi:MAG: LUD domain-containing protein [Ferruginibacter sp.]|nr:LUD domain-containing protein [Ferruginibacter sp.]